MLKTLLKKQLREINRSFFVSQKTGKGKTRAGAIRSILMFAVLMVGVLGGTFFMLANGICRPLMAFDMGWLYFLIISGMALLLGVIGSVFSTYASLYCAKDNDILLSMPIPVGMIIATRLIGVYLMGALYSGVVMVPAIIVYAVNGATVLQLLSSIAYAFLLSVLILCLSCALGWVVAKISVHVRRKSFVTTLLTLIGVAAYYYLYAKAQAAIKELIANCLIVGEKIEEQASLLVTIGRAATGSGVSLLTLAALAGILTVLIYILISRSFIRIATTPQNSRIRVKADWQVDEPMRSVDRTLLRREAARLFSSPIYLMNCALGTFLMPVAAVILFIMGRGLTVLLYASVGMPEDTILLICAALVCMLVVMNDITAASVSVEGKTIYITQSLPVDPWKVLEAKLRLHLLMTLPTALLLACGMAFALMLDIPESLLLIGLALLSGAWAATFGLSMNLLRPNLHWTTETAAVKQGASVAFALFGGWAAVIILAAIYLLTGQNLEPELYMAICAAVFAAASLFRLAWIKKRGARIYAALR